MDIKGEDSNRAIERDRDSILTFLLARSVSSRITPCLVETKITPLQLTILGLFCGVFAAFLCSFSIWTVGVLAAILIEVSHILDCMDGELARITDRGSLFAAAFDPISDRIKDLVILIAAYINAKHSLIFDLSAFSISLISIITVGLWLVYLYIVDAHLNPARKSKISGTQGDQGRLYLGLYDLFIYGSIVFLIFNIFAYFIIYILIISILAIPVQLYRLKKIYSHKNR